jgi:hypothetical protein
MRREEEEEEEDMGSTLVGPTIEDVDDVSLPPPSVAIDIDGGGGGGGSTTSSQVTHADLLALEERVNLLLAATSREQSAVNARLDEMRQLDLAATLAAAAQDCAAAAKAAVQVLESAKAAVELLASDDFVQEQLEGHARHAAVAIRDVVVSASADAAAAVAADVKKATSKRR